MSVNDSYLLMRTKHVFLLLLLFIQTYFSLSHIFKSLILLYSLWVVAMTEIFVWIFWTGLIVLNELFYSCWSTLIIWTLVSQHELNYTFLLSIQNQGETEILQWCTLGWWMALLNSIFSNIARCKIFARFLKYFVYLALFQTIKQRFFELNTKKRNIICTHHHICVVFVFKHSCSFNCLATHKKKNQL